MSFDRSSGAGGDYQNAQAFRLCSDVAVVVWDLPRQAPTATRCTLAAQRQPVPLVSLMLPLTDGRRRILWAMRTGETAEELEIQAGGADTLQRLVLEPVTDLPPVDLDDLFASLAPEGRIKFLNNLLSTWRSAFRLSRDQIFASVVRDAVFTLMPAPRPARVACRMVEKDYLLETSVDAALAEISAVYAVAEGSVAPLPARYVMNGGAASTWRHCHLLIEASRPPSSPLLLILQGKKGIAVRELLDAPARVPDFQQWWSQEKRPPELREFVVRQLSQRSDSGTAAAVDLQLRAPLPARRIAKSSAHPGAEVDLAVASSGGLLAGGWTHDPASSLAGVDFLKEDGSTVALDRLWYEYPGWARMATDAPKTEVTGFVAWLPLKEPVGALLQPRFQLRLKSGTVKPLIPNPQPVEPAAQRARILRAVPPQHAIDQTFKDILAPALQETERRLGESVAVRRTKDYGLQQKAPLVSIVVPLYRVLDFLRFQMSAMATDPWLVANAELIYVLDSPEIQDETEHLLGGLHLLHGLSMKFVVMNRNSGYARACNAGARHARGTILVMLNSDVVPCAPGWLQPLSNALLERKKLGAVGPKLIFEDGSLQHAGLYFARDHRGTWLNHHFYKGMPGHYGPAQEARDVPAVTGACLITRRDIFELVGGYTEDYVIGDYEDSDLCLKIRQIGFQISYEPAASLYHFERRSIRRSDDYMRGVASQYNAWLHGQRWNADIGELMTRFLGEAADETIAPFNPGKTARSAA
ncbi:glycosyltransferase family 2 protein [Nitratireductor sp. ZSWI3]|uniref:glycosyltransferase family 2 protein n=1 Tax=Nitratireductor sp. ZSWI3 TaxID=2966359 RepID=UPI00214FD623|nr:glycosyltransferase family 2 protein [Nitratireductor sp. ZSWI3]MCR4266989.1 glycosyltransferase family 2 protein [Nitratireductor sp. ZSWI3]